MINKYKVILGALCGLAISVTVLSGRATKTQAAEIAINETSFPDKLFREYVEKNIDKDGNKILSDKEIKETTYLNLDNKYAEPEYAISNLKGIEYFSYLNGLSCSDNRLTRLNIFQNTMLKSLDCSNNQITELNISQNTMLEYLECSGNQIKELYTEKNTVLENLYCNNNKLGKLDISKNTVLKDIECLGNKLTKLDISNNTVLKDLNCSFNKVAHIDTSNNQFLEELDCSYNKLTSIDASKNLLLKSLFCYSLFEGSYLTELKLNRQCYKTLTVYYGIDDKQYSDFDNESGKDDGITYESGLFPISNITDGYAINQVYDLVDITKPGILQNVLYRCDMNGDRKEYKKVLFTIFYIDPSSPNPYPTGDFTLSNCKHLFDDYNYTNPISGSAVVIYGNGKKNITGNTKQFIAYTDISASYIYTTNSKGTIKAASGKVIAGITKSDKKPVVIKNKIIDKDAAKIAKARIKNGQVTVTATGKEKGMVYLWIIDTGRNGIYEMCPINVQMAPRKLEVQDIAGNKLKNPKIELGQTLDVCIAGIVSNTTKTIDCSYTAIVDGKYQEYIKVKPNKNSNNKFIIKVFAVKDDKNTKVVVTFQCDQNGKKVKFPLTILADNED
ncbi:MAG: hypothetical protein K1W24_15385 [Lachnospiraceae bacterium]